MSLRLLTRIMVLSREPSRKHEGSESDFLLRSGHRDVPMLSRFVSEGAQRSTRNEMALQVEGVVDSCMCGEKVLISDGDRKSTRLPGPT